VPLAEICRRYQVKELSAFGSAARGELRPESDIGLLVDLVPKGGLKKLIRPHILKESRLVYAA
jgi:predicted nucleotidyltransferase